MVLGCVMVNYGINFVQLFSRKNAKDLVQGDHKLSKIKIAKNVQPNRTIYIAYGHLHTKCKPNSEGLKFLSRYL